MVSRTVHFLHPYPLTLQLSQLPRQYLKDHFSSTGSQVMKRITVHYPIKGPSLI